MKARWKKKVLQFKRASGTSRGVITTKSTYFMVLEDEGKRGIGECSPLKGLSIDDNPHYEEKLSSLVDYLLSRNLSSETLHSAFSDLELQNWPSIRFGLEMAIQDFLHGGHGILYPSEFTKYDKGIPINGLIWMGEPTYMKVQVKSLLERGFTCLKMKIGAINFKEELSILQALRREYNPKELILRVDANGAFSVPQALEKLKILSELQLHSIEQPIMAGQLDEMAQLCAETPLPIALDEELISVQEKEEKAKVLEHIKPQFIILKPSLVGGFLASEEWIEEATKLGVGWWATSALESNIGLNAITQWTYTKNPVGHQGLGTGSLYKNNIESPLEVIGEEIYYNINKRWKIDELAG